jgi:hypothetical protein
LVGAMMISPGRAAVAEPIRIGVAVRAAVIIVPGILIPGILIPGILIPGILIPGILIPGP